MRLFSRPTPALLPFALVAALSVTALVVSACAPKVGTPEWCEAMKKKPKGDWSSNETVDFAKNCVF